MKEEARQGEEENQKIKIKEDKEELSNKYQTNLYPIPPMYKDLESMPKTIDLTHQEIRSCLVKKKNKIATRVVAKIAKIS